jgi:hypothetical protein
MNPYMYYVDGHVYSVAQVQCPRDYPARAWKPKQNLSLSGIRCFEASRRTFLALKLIG